MVINFSLGRDEDYRAARRGEREEQHRKKGGGRRDRMREEVCVCVQTKWCSSTHIGADGHTRAYQQQHSVQPRNWKQLNG